MTFELPRRTARLFATRAALISSLLAGSGAAPWAFAAPVTPGRPPLTAASSSREDEATGTDREQARASFREGLALLDAGEYASSLESFERAYAIWNNPKILLNIATAQRALGRLSLAANNYALYQRTAEPDSSRAEEVAQILATLDAGLGRLVFPHVSPEQRFWLNDEPLSVRANEEIRIEPGEYWVRSEQPGKASIARRIAVWPGELLRLELTPETSPRSSEPAPERDDAEDRRARLPARHEARVRLLARADVDVQRQGAVGALGTAVAMTDFFRISGGALLGAHQGLWLGLELLPSRQWLSPVLGLSAPVFFVNGVRPGVSADIGLRVEATRRFALFARVSAAHFPNVPRDYARTLYLPAVGVEVGL